jgi:hypothetical protein
MLYNMYIANLLYSEVIGEGREQTVALKDEKKFRTQINGKSNDISNAVKINKKYHRRAFI